MKNTLNLRPATCSEYVDLVGIMDKISIHFLWRYSIFERRFIQDIVSIIDRKLKINY